MDIIKELDKLIDRYYSEEIDSRDEFYREIVYLKDKVFAKNESDKHKLKEEQKSLLIDYNNYLNIEYHSADYDDLDINVFLNK